MPGIGHLAVGRTAARVMRPPVGVRRWAWATLLTAASFAPDADVVAFRFGIPYGAPLGHRGATHSLAFAVLCGASIALAARLSGVATRPMLLALAAVMASHGILDAFTDGGRGAALLRPFSGERHFARGGRFRSRPSAWESSRAAASASCCSSRCCFSRCSW